MDAGGEAAIGAALGPETIAVEVIDDAHAACVMAAVTGELGGAPGVVLLDRPDSLDVALAALRQARRDRSPLLVVERGEGSAALAEEAVGAAVKASVTDTGDGEGVLAAARLALAHPRGPVRVELRDDGPRGIGEAREGRGASRPRGEDPATWPAPSPRVLDAIADLVAGSSRPVVLAGLEARTPDDCAWLRAFAEALPAPVITTGKARGALPEPHPLALGVLGVNDAVLLRADLVVALGVDPVELEGIEWRARAPVARVAWSPSGASPFHLAVEVVASIASVLEELAPRLKGRTRADWDVAELDRAKRALVPGPAEAARIVALLREATPAGTVATVEASWLDATSGWQCTAPGELLGPLPPGVAGYAVPAAVAARLARPDRPIVCFTDGPGLAGSLASLEMAVQRRLGFVVVALTPCPPAVLEASRAIGVDVAGTPGAIPLGRIASLASGDRPVVIPAG